MSQAKNPGLAVLKQNNGAEKIGFENENVNTALKNRTVFAGTVSEVEALTLPVGASVYLTEEGRAGEGVIKSGTPPTDTYKGIYIVIANGNYWERSDKTKITPEMFGVVVNAGTDQADRLQAFLSLAGTFAWITEPTGEYLSSKTLIQPDNQTLVFTGSAKIKASAVDQGAVFNVGNKCVVWNPQIDAGGPSIITGGSGNNGIAVISDRKAIVYGGNVSNCARGNVSPFDGGKGVQCESSNIDAAIHDTVVENSHMAVSARRDMPLGSKIKVTFSNVKAVNCNHYSFTGMANIAITETDAMQVSIINPVSINAGALDALTEANSGLFLFSRAVGVSILGGRAEGATSLEGIFRGRFRGLTVSGFKCNQDCTGVVNIDPDTLYAIDTSLGEDNSIDLSYDGTAQYLFKSDLSDSTFANRVLHNSGISARLKNDVSVSLVTSATRNGTGIITVQKNRELVSGDPAEIHFSVPNMASLPARSFVHRRALSLPPTYTAAQIGDATNEVNTKQKQLGTHVFNTSDFKPYYAIGTGATGQWRAGDGATTITPA